MRFFKIILFAICCLLLVAPASADKTGLLVWLKADEGTGATNDGDPVQTWQDFIAPQQNIFQNTFARRPTFQNDAASLWNFNPVLNFDLTNNQYFRIADDAGMNLARVYYKTFFVAFRTGSNVNTRQVVYEEGGGTRGMNAYIFNNNLYFSGWNLANDGGIGAPWAFTSVNTPIDANTEYIITFVLNGNNTVSGTIDMYLNGLFVGSAANVGRLNPHSADMGSGG